MTQRNAAGAEESAGAATELNAQAEALNDALADLDRLVEDVSAAPVRGTPAPLYPGGAVDRKTSLVLCERLLGTPFGATA